MRLVLSFLALLSGVGVCATENCATEKKEVLRLDVFPIESMNPMEVHVIVTNISDAPLTIPTRSYGEGVDGWIHGGGNVGILFSIGSGMVGEYKLVPSPLRFFPVTLRPGESTELPVVHVTRREEKTVEVVFGVDEDYARRHGWWFGRLKKKVVIGEGPNPYLVAVEAPSPSLTVPPEKKQKAEPASPNASP